MQSKLEHILRPLQEAHGSASAFLVLQKGIPVYSRSTDDGRAAGCDWEPNEEEVRAAFGEFFTAAIFPPFSADAFAAPLHRWPSYRKSDADYKYVKRMREENLAHLTAQHENVAACARLIERHEATVGGRYRLVVRVRDNTLAVRPLQLATLGSSFGRAPLFVKGCNGWGGLNDKVAVAPRELLRGFGAAARALRSQVQAEAPLPRWTATSVLTDAPNAETLLQRALEAAGGVHTVWADAAQREGEARVQCRGGARVTARAQRQKCSLGCSLAASDAPC